jgi:diguanylate cyclase (GGDEF)-like protein
MSLDLPTLMIMQSFAVAAAGAFLCVAWAQNRAATAWALWGLANLIAAAGLVALMLGATRHWPTATLIGNFLMPTQAGLMWKAARTLDSKRAPLAMALFGPLAASLAAPLLHNIAGTAALAVGAAYAIATAHVFWAGHTERLTARWPLLGLTVMHAGALLVGTYSAIIGSTGQDAVPAVMSLFGFIYFESIIFALGTSVFVFALVKERNEAASIAAAHKDSLTGIDDRAAFMANGERVLRRSRGDAVAVSVIMFDLDQFKTINDRYGHPVGDVVIRQFCKIAAAVLRPNDLFARMGGEEFAALLPGTCIETACLRAERIRLNFADGCRFVSGHSVNATVSCGVSATTNAEHTLEVLLEASDAALYLAKAEGRNRVRRADRLRADVRSSTVHQVA